MAVATLPLGRKTVADQQQVIASFPRNREETMQVSIATFKGKTYVDIRLYFTDPNGQLQPSRKGVTIPPELWDQFRQALREAEAELVRRNLWHPPEALSEGV
ncbi:MAG: transcriptional coactivator p15/PC4 family protein [Thermoanaerobaculum sp.]|nr:transcriptional coactivator p15/PC4 family protein [Thermoanaerobaculum sp.]